MALSNSIKSLSLFTGTTIGTLLLNYIFLTNSATAFSFSFTNTDFESPVIFDETPDVGWEGTGDTFIDSATDNTFSQIAPVDGTGSQALITTGRHTVPDDPNTPASTFNYSGRDPVTATTNDGADALQDFLGLSTGALSIKRLGLADDNQFRTAKEGSGIYQDFTITIEQSDIDSGNNIFELSFNWAYLTNEPTDSRLGDQDFAFFTVFDTSSPVNGRSIAVLDHSDGSVTTPLDSGVTNFQDVNTTNYNVGNLYTYTSDPIAEAGTYTYRVGLGVVDVDGLDRTSSLLVDNFSVQQVPFEFSPTAGIAFMLGLFGCDRLRWRMKMKNKINIV